MTSTPKITQNATDNEQAKELQPQQQAAFSGRHFLNGGRPPNSPNPSGAKGGIRAGCERVERRAECGRGWARYDLRKSAWASVAWVRVVTLNGRLTPVVVSDDGMQFVRVGSLIGFGCLAISDRVYLTIQLSVSDQIRFSDQIVAIGSVN